ncbi:DUF2806 domain-containing protein [Flavobacterium sp.]|jgi:uncharacterized repeat protein (TIGR03899 family)|uniref:DUF2806 domain-containing protein n=1 Tax=Flavobacterium sp. TaxID=239 RepID=UPI0037C04245
MSLIKFEGKPIEKLIEVISQGIGTLYKPRAIRKEAEAEAYKIGIIEKAKANAIAEGKIIDLELYENIQERIIHQETRKQINIDNITQIAANQLNQEKEVSEEKVDNDWTTRFFKIAEDISDDEMQNLWGRILAGEIKQPKSFSLRTLEILKNLSKYEAEIFTKFANLKLKSGNTNVIYNQDNGKFLESEFGITFPDRLLMTELGLIASENNLEFSFSATAETERTDVLIYGDKGIVLYKKTNVPKQGIQVLVFTSIGGELSKLIEQDININYIKKVCSSFVSPNVRIEYGDIVNFPNGQTLLLNKTEYNE